MIPLPSGACHVSESVCDLPNQPCDNASGIQALGSIFTSSSMPLDARSSAHSSSVRSFLAPVRPSVRTYRPLAAWTVGASETHTFFHARQICIHSRRGPTPPARPRPAIARGSAPSSYRPAKGAVADRHHLATPSLRRWQRLASGLSGARAAHRINERLPRPASIGWPWRVARARPTAPQPVSLDALGSTPLRACLPAHLAPPPTSGMAAGRGRRTAEGIAKRARHTCARSSAGKAWASSGRGVCPPFGHRRVRGAAYRFGRSVPNARSPSRARDVAGARRSARLRRMLNCKACGRVPEVPRAFCVIRASTTHRASPPAMLRRATLLIPVPACKLHDPPLPPICCPQIGRGRRPTGYAAILSAHTPMRCATPRATLENDAERCPPSAPYFYEPSRA